MKRIATGTYHFLAVTTKSMGDFFVSLVEMKTFIKTGALSRSAANIIFALSTIPLFILRWLKNLDKSQNHVQMLEEARKPSAKTEDGDKKSSRFNRWGLTAITVILAGLSTFALYPLLGEAFRGIFHFLGVTGRAIPGVSVALGAIFLTFAFLDTIKDLKTFWSELSFWYKEKWKWWCKKENWKKKHWLNETLRVIGYLATAGMAVATGFGIFATLPFSGPGAIILAAVTSLVVFFTSANTIGDYLSQFKQRILWSLGLSATDKTLKDASWNQLNPLFRASLHGLALSMAIGATFLLVFTFPPAIAIPVGISIALCSYILLIQGLKDLCAKLSPEKPSTDLTASIADGKTSSSAQDLELSNSENPPVVLSQQLHDKTALESDKVADFSTPPSTTLQASYLERHLGHLF